MVIGVLFRTLIGVPLMTPTPRSRANDKERNGANEAVGWQEAPGDDECVIALTPVSALGRLIRLALLCGLGYSFLLALIRSREALDFACYKL